MKIFIVILVTGSLVITFAGCSTGHHAQIVTDIDEGFNVPLIIPDGPSSLAPSFSGDRLFALRKGGTELVVVEPSKGVVKSFSLDFRGSQIVVGNNDSHIFITSYATRKSAFSGVIKLDILTGQVDKLEMEKSFYSLGGKVSHDGRKLFLSNVNGKYLLVIDIEPFEISRKIPLWRLGGVGLDVSPDSSKVYVTHLYAQSLSIVRLESKYKVVSIEDIGGLPVAIDVDEVGRYALILDNKDHSIKRVDLRWREVLATYPTAEQLILKDKVTFRRHFPYGKVYGIEGGHYALVWNTYLKRPIVINFEKNISLYLNYESTGVAFNERQNYFVFSNEDKNEIRIFGLMKIRELFNMAK